MSAWSTQSYLRAFAFLFATMAGAAFAQHDMARYNVIWNSPSKDASETMPIGNGDMGANVYAIEDGDLFLLLSKNDALTFCGDVIKTGRAKISLFPNPFAKGKPFRQTLDLVTGSILIEADGVTIRIWADANSNVCHVEIQAPWDLMVTVKPDLWKRIIPYSSQNRVNPKTVPPEIPQDILIDRPSKLLWFYTVGDQSILPMDLKEYEVEQLTEQFPDPFRFNTFGHLIEIQPTPGTSLTHDGGYVLGGNGKRFDIRIHALKMQTPTPDPEWSNAIENQARMVGNTPTTWKAHCAWWKEFWERSWIAASDTSLPSEDRERLMGDAESALKRMEKDGAALVSQSYNVFRFLMACQSRGTVQTKFNGGIFTQQLKLPASKDGKPPRPYAELMKDGTYLTNEDDRLWGRRFTFQNQRLLYWPLYMSGDEELLDVFMEHYTRLLPMRKAITQKWFGHEGAYYRENVGLSGDDRDHDNAIRPPKTKPGEKYNGHWHDYYFTCGLETIAMMIEFVRYTENADVKKEFTEKKLLPFAREVLLFFDKHYARDEKGKLRLDPAQVLESYWVAVNPAPDIAGLRFCLQELLAMKVGTPVDQATWASLLKQIPDVPMREVDGKQVIAPAEQFATQRNSEVGELYPVFPFSLFGLAQGSQDLVDRTLRNYTNKGALRNVCWAQQEIHWALAGNAEETSKNLVERFRITTPMCRFPLFGREGPDSCPDFDHFGSGSIAFQRMLVQEGREWQTPEAAGKIYLFPAWPAHWDVDFKLHISNGGTVTGRVKNGKIEQWDVTPASRKKDVVLQPLWQRPSQ